MSVPRKYPVIRAIALVLKILAWVALALGLLAAIVAVTATSNMSPAMATIAGFVRSVGLIVGPLVGIIWFVQLYAFGSVLSLLVEIEENTRALALEPTATAGTLERT